LDRLACNQDNRWAPGLMDDKRRFAQAMATQIEPYLRPNMSESDGEALQETLNDLARNWMIRTVLVHGNLNNLGAAMIPQVTWRDEAGQDQPLVIFHSGVTPAPADESSCFRSLVSEAGVRHVINLYDAELPLQDLLDAEERVAQEMGATYTNAATVEDYRGWRSVVGDAEAEPEARQRAMEAVAQLIREQVLQPQGQPLRGHVYFHCGGGMHRSATIFGVMRRCLAGEDLDTIRADVQRHSSYISDSQPGGYEPPIMDFVRDFDCSLLQLAAPAETEQTTPQGDN
jgi:hypothetical protein